MYEIPGEKTMQIVRLSCRGKGVIQTRSMHYVQRRYVLSRSLETAVHSRMFSPQNGALETGLQARNENELSSAETIGHAFISMFEAF
jgi:hypothetical protein